jgi:predicted RNase H-like HicB family nuclease
MRYAIVIERAEGNLSAYVPDLPGCVATGATVLEVEAEIREAGATVEEFAALLRA